MSSPSLEEVILGAILDAEGPVLKTSAGLLVEMSGMKPQDFTLVRCRVAWQVVQRLAQARRPVDSMTVFAAGKTARKFSDADRDWLQSLQYGNQLDRDRFSNVCESMRTAARAKQLEAILEAQLASLRGGTSDVGAVAGALESSLKELLSASLPDGTGEDDVMEVSTDWDQQEAGTTRPTLIPTGMAFLDELIGGWVQNLNLVGALPSVGKSALLASCIDGQTKAGLKVGLFGLEDGTKWLARRIIAREMGIPVRDVGWKQRTPEQQVQFGDVGAAAAQQLRNLICYRRGGLSVRDLLQRAAHWVRNKDVNCIWIDHGGEIDHSADGMDEEQMNYRVAATYSKLRDFAVEYGVPVVAMAHAKRPYDGNEERPPLMTELADSSKLEKASRVFLGCWRRYSEPDFMRVTVVKATEGEPNITAKVKRFRTAALLDGSDWERVDLLRERANEAKAKREAKEAERRAAAEAAKAAKEAAKRPKQKPIFEEPSDAAE